MAGKKESKNAKITIKKNGPYLVSGGLPLDKEEIVCNSSGDPESYGKVKEFPDQEQYSLCRCGKSKCKPFCDGSHIEYGFDGTETADRRKYSECAQKMEGPHITLMDQQDLCVGAGFCHRKGGTWKLSQSKDKKDADLAVTEACDCPSGRLVACDKKTGKPMERDEGQSVTLLQDTRRGVSGPICLRGGIPIESSDGSGYEKRSRVTLCRCGKSENKPFCDGSHVGAGFSDDK